MNIVDNEFQNPQKGGMTGIRNIQNKSATISPVIEKTNVTVIESKKCRTDGWVGLDNQLGPSNEILQDTCEDVNMGIDQIDPNNGMIPKNGQKASAHAGARLALWAS